MNKSGIAATALFLALTPLAFAQQPPAPASGATAAPPVQGDAQAKGKDGKMEKAKDGKDSARDARKQRRAHRKALIHRQQPKV